MKNFWAPWRYAYISQPDAGEKGCIFCTKPAEEKDPDNLILKQTGRGFVILNRYPYNNGHLMVVPKIHTRQLSDLPPETILEIFWLIEQSVKILSQKFKAEGFNIGVNLGRVAGAGIDDHVHFHVVPRWNGDTNFMPVFAEIKVISQHLTDTYQALVPEFEKLRSEAKLAK